MRVRLIRGFQDNRVTLGMLQIDGVDHDPIFTLENPRRETSQDSVIPAGNYKCRPYSGTKYKDVYEVMGVPGRTAILIHSGNTEKDTLGCILVGLGGAAVTINNSRLALDRLRSLIGKKEFDLEIRDP